MAFSPKTLIKIRTVYEMGLSPLGEICRRFKISRDTLRIYAKKNGWVYGKTRPESVITIHQKTAESVVRAEVDKAIRVTEDFLQLSKALQFVTSQEVTKLTKGQFADFNRLKSARISTEIITMLHDGQRKALGLIDRNDKKEAPVIQANILINMLKDPEAAMAIDLIVEKAMEEFESN